jgi:hypothetical protein
MTIKLQQDLILANINNMQFVGKKMLDDLDKIKEYVLKDNINQNDINTLLGSLRLNDNSIKKLKILKEGIEIVIGS